MADKSLPKETPEEKDLKTVSINEVLQSLEPEKREVLSRAIYAIEERKSFTGPLPAPEDFLAYKKVLPDAPERILSMAERQLNHRIETERKIVDSGIKESRLGQYLGAAIVILCLAGSVYLGIHGHDLLAGSIVAIIAAVSTIFVLRKEPDKDSGSSQNNNSDMSE